MALENLEFKDQIGLIWRRTNRMGRRRRRREEEEGEPSQKGMETHLDYESYEIWHGSLVL